MNKNHHRMSPTARVDRAGAHKARYFVRIDGVWCGFRNKYKADWTRKNPSDPAAIYARGMSLTAIRELIERKP